MNHPLELSIIHARHLDKVSNTVLRARTNSTHGDMHHSVLGIVCHVRLTCLMGRFGRDKSRSAALLRAAE